jgi:Leucine-rich repeat (LRR) protein
LRELKEGYAHVQWFLNTIPESITTLTHLKHLDICWFDFHHFPFFIQEITSLKKLSIIGCRFPEIPDEFNISESMDLIFANNGLRATPSWLLRHAKQSRLTEKFSKMGVDEREWEVLSLLEIVWSEMLIDVKGHRNSKIESEYIGDPSDCTVFSLNEAGHVNSICFGKQEYEAIGYLPIELCLLTELEELYLINENITEIPACLLKLKKLKKLNLEGNNIAKIPDVTHGNPDLQIIIDGMFYFGTYRYSRHHLLFDTHFIVWLPNLSVTP